jgi:hypothetical protein
MRPPDLFCEMTYLMRRTTESRNESAKPVSKNEELCDNLCSPNGGPNPTQGCMKDGRDHPVSATSCARLFDGLESEYIKGDFTLPSGRHSITDKQEVFRRYLLPLAPIDDCGRSHGRYSGSFGRSAQGANNFVHGGKHGAL